MEKMTKSEMYAFIKSNMSGNAEVSNFCDNEIALLQKKATRAKATAAAKKAAGDELTNVVAATLTSEPQTIADVVAKIEGPDVTAAKVSYRLTSLVKSNQAKKTEVTIPGVEGLKSRKVMAYSRA